jgi:hypothetical protein
MALARHFALLDVLMKESKIPQVNGPAAHCLKANQILLSACCFFSRRLLTEKSSITVNPFVLDVAIETLTMRAAMLTTTITENPCYSRCGLND